MLRRDGSGFCAEWLRMLRNPALGGPDGIGSIIGIGKIVSGQSRGNRFIYRRVKFSGDGGKPRFEHELWFCKRSEGASWLSLYPKSRSGTYDRILVPLDGSPMSTQTLHYVRILGTALMSLVEFLRVYEPEPVYYYPDPAHYSGTGPVDESTPGRSLRFIDAGLGYAKSRWHQCDVQFSRPSQRSRPSLT